MLLIFLTRKVSVSTVADPSKGNLLKISRKSKEEGNDLAWLIYDASLAKAFLRLFNHPGKRIIEGINYNIKVNREKISFISVSKAMKLKFELKEFRGDTNQVRRRGNFSQN